MLNWGVKSVNKNEISVFKYQTKIFGNEPTSLVAKILYWLIFIGFFGLMLEFVAPTFGKPTTLMALLLVAIITLTPTNYRYAGLTFIAGSGLGYFLELWGTTRQCWTYYSFQTPPLFAVLAHGMAAVAFWRAWILVKQVWGKLTGWIPFKKITLKSGI